MNPKDTKLTCREVVEFVTDYQLGALPPEQQATIERHLYLCPGCDAYVDQMRATVRLASGLRRPSDDSVEQNARSAFRRWKKGPRP